LAVQLHFTYAQVAQLKCNAIVVEHLT